MSYVAAWPPSPGQRSKTTGSWPAGGPPDARLDRPHDQAQDQQRREMPAAQEPQPLPDRTQERQHAVEPAPAVVDHDAGDGRDEEPPTDRGRDDERGPVRDGKPAQ